MQPTNPTIKPDLTVHAARLREMAASAQAEVETLRLVCDDPQVSMEPEQSDVAALLAGAAALEAVEVAKAALMPFARGAVAIGIAKGDFSTMRERIVDWHGPSDFRIAHAALAKLEALDA